MLFKFIGQYTNGRSTIMACGVLFEGHEPADVTDPDGIRRLTNHPEFERVTEFVAPEEEQPKPRRGRPKKEVSE